MKPTVLPLELERELQSIDCRHAIRIAEFILLYFAAAVGTVWVGASFQWSLPAVLLCLPLYLVSAASLHGLSLFTHEGVHGGLSQRPWLNRAISIVCAIPVLQNYSGYRVLHMRHHNDTGGGLDPDHYANYSEKSRRLFFMHWARLLLGYPVYITAIPILGFRQGNRSERRWIVFECSLLAVLTAAILASPVPWTWLIHAWLIPMVLINTMVNIRGMSQHTFLEEPRHPIRGTRTILARPIVAFFMCNENYHLEHHLYPRVPWYNLPRLHRALKTQLDAERAPFIPSYLSFVRTFVLASFKLLREPAPVKGSRSA